MNEAEFTQLIHDISTNVYQHKELTINYSERFGMTARCRRIEAALQTNTYVKALHFNGHVTAGMLQSLPPLSAQNFDQPRVNPITELDFSDATFFNVIASARAAEMIANNANIESLNLSNHARNLPFISFILGILVNNGIRSFALADSVSIDGISHYLSIMVSQNRNLQDLNLRGCKLNFQNFNALMNLVGLSNIQKFVFPHIPAVEPQLFRELCTSLTKVMSNNGNFSEIEFYSLSQPIMQAVFDGIQANDSLKIVRFKNCEFSEVLLENCVAVLNGKPNLEELSFMANTQHTARDSDVFLRALAATKYLEVLELSHFKFDEENISYRDVLAHNTSLNNVAFCACKFSQESLRVLAESLAANISITEIIFSHNEIAREAISHVLEIPRRNPNIMSLRVAEDDPRVNALDRERLAALLQENNHQVQTALRCLQTMDYESLAAPEFLEFLMPRLKAVTLFVGGYPIAKSKLLKLASDGLCDVIDPTKNLDYDAGSLIAHYATDGDDIALFHFLRSGLQFRIEQAKKSALVGRQKLDDFVLEKFRNGKFPLDWNMLSEAVLQSAIEKYLQPPQRQEEGSAKRMRVLTLEEKVEKLLENGLKLHDSYQIIAGKINAEFGVKLPDLVDEAESSSLAAGRLSGDLANAEPHKFVSYQQGNPSL